MPTFAITFTEAHLLEALRRHRRCKRFLGRFPELWVIIPFSILILITFSSGDVEVAAALAFVTVAVVLITRVLERFFTRRNFRKSPFHNERITIALSHEGFTSDSARGNAQLTWSAFTAYRRFPDGWALLQSPAIIYWLPQAALTQGTPAEVDELLQQCIPATPSSQPASPQELP